MSNEFDNTNSDAAIPPGSGASPTVDFSSSTDGPGSQIGRYKLLQLIGEGGFGSVYMAQQEEPVRRKVALKIIKLGMDTKQVIARFEAERQALALMDHANIARVLDAGSTETGRPYFVMELVRGVPVTEYCRKNKLTTTDRLELFTRICLAIQHAHHKGIIHRDLKPTNVLVTLHDGVPVPKVIDFGIAKALHQRLTEKTLFTEYHQFMGTPVYMSPEQAEMSGLDIDARADIYSLGVLLYELLTGTTPFDVERLKSLSHVDIQKLIREEDPDKPSMRLSTMGDEATTTAAQQQTDRGTLRRSLKGDLDCIVMKALEKDRTRRYETAHGFMLDVRRYLAGEPVLASPPSAFYRASKFVRRHRVAVGVAALVVVALVSGLVLATIGFAQANKERAVARAEAESARAINSFFADMLGSVDPQQLRLHSAFAPEREVAATTEGGFDRNVSVVEMLNRGGERLEETFEGKPALEAEVRETIGITLAGLGRSKDAEPHLARAVEIRREIFPEDHTDLLRSELQLGHLLMDAKRVQAARDGFERVYGPEHPKTLSATSFLAHALTMDGSASQLSNEAPQIDDGIWSAGKFDSARDVFCDTLEKQRQVLGDEHRDVVFTLLRWAEWYGWRGGGEEKLELAHEVYGITRKSFSPDDALTMESVAEMGWALILLGKYDEGEKYLREALEKQVRVLGPDHPETCTTMMGLGLSLNRPEDLDEKENLWRRAFSGLRKTEGAASPLRWVVSRDLADLHLRRGEAEEAIRLYREMYEACLEDYSESNHWTTDAEGLLLAGLRAVGRHAEARAHVKEGLDTLCRRAEREDATTESLNSCAWKLLICWPPELRNPAAALPLAEKALEMALPRDSGNILDAMARACWMTGDLPRAIEIQRRAVAMLESRTDPGAEDLVLKLVFYLTLAGDTDEAIEETRLQVRAMAERGAREQVDLAVSLHDFGVSLVGEGLWLPAEVALVAAREPFESLTEPNPDHHIQTLVELCGTLAALGKLDEANERLAEAESLAIKAHGESSLEYASEVLYAVGRHYSRVDRGAEAIPLYRRASASCSAVGEEGIDDCRRAELCLARELALLGETEEALRIGYDLIRYWSEARGGNDRTVGAAREILGMAFLRSGNLDSAEQELREALNILRLNLVERRDPVTFAEAKAALAECLTVRKKYAEAESLLLGAQDLVDEYGKDNPRMKQVVHECLMALYESWGKPAFATRWRDRADHNG